MKVVLILTGLLGAASAQTPPPRLEFEAVSVKPSAVLVSGQTANAGKREDGAQAHYNRASLRGLIMTAYDLKTYQVIGPDWLGTARFDIDAKLPPGAARTQVPQMLQSLLADRFGLKAHNDTKVLPVYALVVMEGGSKLKNAAESEEQPDSQGAIEIATSSNSTGINADYGNGTSASLTGNKFAATKLPMARFAATLLTGLSLPVIDMTGLTGKYDFAITLSDEDTRGLRIQTSLNFGGTVSPESRQFLESVDFASLYEGLRVLGLKLEPRKVAVPVLVIDSLSKTPTEN